MILRRKKTMPEFRRYAVEPGDVIVVEVERRLSQAEAKVHHESVKYAFPENVVLIADGGAKVRVFSPWKTRHAS